MYFYSTHFVLKFTAFVRKLVTENISITNISETSYNYVILNDDTVNDSVLYDQINGYITNFTADIYDRRENLRYTGQNCTESSGWNFPSALLFTITVITSIGYGYITPVSW